MCVNLSLNIYFFGFAFILFVRCKSCGMKSKLSCILYSHVNKKHLGYLVVRCWLASVSPESLRCYCLILDL